MTSRVRASLVGLVLAACGGGGPTAPEAPPPAAPPATLGAVATVRGLLFYDENDNARLDAGEDVRLPEVRVSIGGRAGETDAAGRFEIAEVPAGSPQAALSASTLPPYFLFAQGPSVPVPPPPGFELALGVTLPIGGNRPNVYMAFGDSITQGDGSRGRVGYRAELQSLLRGRFGPAQVLNEGVSGTESDRGLARLPDSLARQRPAFTLIHYGTNDWNGFGCRTVCGTPENLRRMVQACRAAQSLPVLATLVPANPAYESRMAAERNAWITATNTQIRAMAAQEGVSLADLQAAFLAEDADLRSLFSDHVHPNDRGYAVMAAEFYRALSAPRSR